MGKIKILSEQVITKIAAGEVVARPASVVKELVDNALDAGATSIEVDIQAGGKKRITVIDNGQGMASEDALMCIERHATSKLSSEKDLEAIRTMGFRGEALAAIAAVSRMKLETKVSDSKVLEGTQLVVEGGAIKHHKTFGCPAGTSITVEDLFFNIPARQKFLRSDNVEYGHIANIVADLALTSNQISFSLTHNGSPKFRYHASENKLSRIEAVFGKNCQDSLVEFAEPGDGISIHGFVSTPNLTRSSAKDLNFILNNRPIKDRILQHALLSGLESNFPRGSYPLAVLYLELDPTLVDVNVHPTKNEVRFSNGQMIHNFVKSAVQKAVSKNVKAIPVYAKTSLLGHSQEMCHSRESGNPIVYKGLDPCFRRDDSPLPLKVIGQFGQAFIICEDENRNLVVVDQHAAHERLGFERLKKQYQAGKVKQQQLLIPEQVALSSKEFAVIEDHLVMLEKAGFEIEPFGGSTLIVKSMPSILGDVSAKPLLEKISTDLAEFEASDGLEKTIEQIFALVACHQQVRAGDKLSPLELEQLIRDIFLENISNCPHGRPALIKIAPEEVEKWFRRT
ncbi:MAG: DNA mismatch repair endonuclease MutL [Pseudomonadota bacterium]